MLSLGQFVLLLGGAFLLWVGVGSGVATIRNRCWPLLLLCVFYVIISLRTISYAVGLWVDQTVTWYILVSIALMAILTFTLKYGGWRILQEYGIGGRQLLLFWQK
jgi:hypothetical protein